MSAHCLEPIYPEWIYRYYKDPPQGTVAPLTFYVARIGREPSN